MKTKEEYQEELDRIIQQLQQLQSQAQELEKQAQPLNIRGVELQGIIRELEKQEK